MEGTEPPASSSARPGDGRSIVAALRPGRRPRSHRFRTGVLAALSTALFGTVLAACSNGGPSTADGSGQHGTTSSIGSTTSRAGSKQVDEGLGQVFAPGSWTVQAQDPCPISVPKAGVLLVGVQPSQSAGCSTLPKAGSRTSILWDFASSEKPHGTPVEVVNGFDLYSAVQGGARGYLAPAVGIELLWSGAEPDAVISTLGWSPLHYVLTGGKVTAPRSWKRQYFDGLSIAAPRSWPVRQPLQLECSGPFDHGPVVGLGVHVMAVPCPYYPPPTTPSDGILVTSTDQLGDCPIGAMLKVAGLEATACSDPSVQPPELQVKLIFGSGTTAATVYVVVGLGGNGTIARQLLASVQAIVPVASGRSA
jgi:hypothetical protein